MTLFGFKIQRLKHLDKVFFDDLRTFGQFLKRSQDIVIFDVGANVGQSVVKYRCHFPNSVIHSFEPVKEVFAELIQQRGHLPMFFPNNSALGKSPGEQVFFVNRRYTPASSFFDVNETSMTVKNNVHPKCHFDERNIEKTVIPVDSVDSYREAHGIERIDILKIDTQGAESDVLQGAQKTLQAGRIDFVLCEISFDDAYNNSSSFLKVEQILIPFGFRLYDISHIYKDLARCRTHWVDVIYVNSTRYRI